METYEQLKDRLEKLEKENKYLKTENVMFKTSCELIKKEEDKLKKAIEILKNSFEYQFIGGNTILEVYYFPDRKGYEVRAFGTKTKEEYELLKEVFSDAK